MAEYEKLKDELVRVELKLEYFFKIKQFVLINDIFL
jgi:hypothetical protein